MVEPFLYRDFAAGTITSLPADKLPLVASPRAFNTQLAPTIGGNVVLMKRPGLTFAATLPEAGAGATVNGVAPFVYTHPSTGVRTRYKIAVTSDGKLWNADEVSPAQITIASLDGSGWTHAGALNSLFMTSGASSFKLFRKSGSTTLYASPIGIAAPAYAPLQTGSSSGLMTGEYEFMLTYYNEDTGTESSAGPSVTCTLTAQQVTLSFQPSLNIPLSEVTHWRLYVRIARLGPYFVRNAAMQFALATTSTTINVSDTTINIMGLRGPDTLQYNPPPAGVINYCWHLGRMFATDGRSVFFSQPSKPEQWDPVNEVRFGLQNERITALASVAEGRLAVFTEKSIFALDGLSPAQFASSKVGEMGSVSKWIAEGDGVIGFWSSQGPAVWDKTSPPVLIANETIAELSAQGVLVIGADDANQVVFDPTNRRFLFSFTLINGGERWTVAPYSTLHKCWEALAWDLPPVHSFCVARSETGEDRVFLGTTDKTIWELDRTALTDGASGELVFTANASPTTALTFTGPDASLTRNPYHSHAYLISPTDMSVEKRVITSASRVGTTHTLVLAGTAATVPAGTIVVIDCPVLEWDCRVAPSALTKLRFHHAHLELLSEGDVPLLYGFFRDSEETPAKVWEVVWQQNQTPEFNAAPPSALADAEADFIRRVGLTGFKWKQRVVGYSPRCRWSIAGIAQMVTRRNDGYR